jgi:hypothetical protein
MDPFATLWQNEATTSYAKSATSSLKLVRMTVSDNEVNAFGNELEVIAKFGESALVAQDNFSWIMKICERIPNEGIYEANSFSLQGSGKAYLTIEKYSEDKVKVTFSGRPTYLATSWQTLFQHLVEWKEINSGLKKATNELLFLTESNNIAVSMGTLDKVGSAVNKSATLIAMIHSRMNELKDSNPLPAGKGVGGLSVELNNALKEFEINKGNFFVFSYAHHDGNLRTVLLSGENQCITAKKINDNGSTTPLFTLADITWNDLDTIETDAIENKIPSLFPSKKLINLLREQICPSCQDISFVQANSGLIQFRISDTGRLHFCKLIETERKVRFFEVMRSNDARDPDQTPVLLAEAENTTLEELYSNRLAYQGF